MRIGILFLATFPASPCDWEPENPWEKHEDSAEAESDGTPPPYGEGSPDAPEGGWDRQDPEHVCRRWNGDRKDRSQGSWSGSTTSCEQGDNAIGRRNALRQVNLVRWLAGLNDDVVTTVERDQMAQECALMMHAEGELSHAPSEGWSCYTEDGAEAAEASVLASVPSVVGVDLYIIDPGNEADLGHRRWLLATELGEVGIGSTSRYSCIWVRDEEDAAARSFTAWPPPGPFPYEAISPLHTEGYSLDDTGWSIQSDTLDLSTGRVRVWEDGVERPLDQWVLDPWFGSRSALAFKPSGWQTRPGSTYTVEVSGVGTEIRYDVEMLGCD